MEKTVYLLEHNYEKDSGYVESKLIGTFSSDEVIQDVIKRYRELPGFRDKPENFVVIEYEVNKKFWTEGFVLKV